MISVLWTNGKDSSIPLIFGESIAVEFYHEKFQCNKSLVLEIARNKSYNIGVKNRFAESMDGTNS